MTSTELPPDHEPPPQREFESARQRAASQRAALAALDPAANDPNAIAIVGMACRFPGAANVAELWHNLRTGVESVSRFDTDQMLAAGADPGLLQDPDYVPAGAILEDGEAFDASFFGINPKEALAMDPQHRAFLECAHAALEDAGYPPESCPTATAIFGGCGLATAHTQILAQSPEIQEALASTQIGVGSYADFLTTRTSFKLDLRGLSLDVQTACSTSLVAVAMAWQALRTGQVDMALAGGVSIRYPRGTGYLYQPGEILAPDGHCRPFDAVALGTLPGEGVGLVVLKRLAAAIADGDTIRAVVRGAALNNDGGGKASFYATNEDAQTEVIVEGLAHAGIDADSVSYIECHGTATPLGDPIEIRSLTRAFRESTDATRFCGVGSVKSNFGHADAAAGIAGIIKTTLALQHELLPPTLHFETPNPEIPFDETPFWVVAKETPWPRGAAPRRAGVNSFGIGGTNAHVVLEEAPVTAAVETPPAQPHQLVVVSAKTETALARTSEALAARLREPGDLSLADIAFTTQLGRTPHPLRRAVVGASPAAVAAELEQPAKTPTAAPTNADGTPPVAFMFPGQGAQYVGMGADLRRDQPVFRDALEHCAECLAPHLEVPLLDALYPAQASEAAAERLAQTALAQPALFAVEYSLAQLWRSWGVEPTAFVGHSVGELVAAALAGVFSLADAAALVAARGRLMQEQPPGSMLSVPLAQAEVEGLLRGDLSLAAVNGPAACVVAGPHDAVLALQQELERKGLPSRPLKTSHAFHSAMMQPVVGPFVELVRATARSAAQTPSVSTVTGEWLDADAWTDPDYWGRNVRQTVRFFDAARTVLDSPRILLEVGPGRTLAALVKQHAARSKGAPVLTSLRHPQDDEDRDAPHLLRTTGALWTAGVGIDWPALHRPHRRRRVPLPTYPFERESFALTVAPAATRARTSTGTTSSSAAQRPAATERLPLPAWFSTPSWARAAAVAGPAPSAAGAAWLVLDDGGGLGATVCRRLRDAGEQALSAKPGEAFASLGDGGYTVNPTDPVTWGALLAELARLGRSTAVVLHLWSVLPSERLDARAAQRNGFHSLIALGRAASDSPFDTFRIALVTNRLQDVTGEPVEQPERATALGACRVLPQELPSIQCRAIDVAPTGESWDLIADQVVAEALASDPEPFAAYRGRARWLQTFRPLPSPAASAPAPWRDGGVYLITGGLGGIGLEFAKWLARRGPVRLVLTARTALPNRETWDFTGSTETVGMQAARIRGVRELEALGAEVLVARADVARRTDMWNVLEQARERFGEVHGVFHAAGISTGTEITSLTEVMAEQVFAAKVKGTLGLAQLLQPERLDFFVVCSSLASILGGLGAASYAGANAFLDAFARSRLSADGTGPAPVMSIAFDTWRDVGLATQTQDAAERAAIDAATVDAIRAAEAADLFDRLFAQPLPEVAVSTTDLMERVRRSRGDAVDQGPPATRNPATPAAAAPTAPPAPAGGGDAIETVIVDCVKQLMGLDEVDVEDSFFDLGVDSLIAHRIAVRLRKTLGRPVPLTAVLEAGTPQKLAARLRACN
ncbi:MAG: SDR family NAD(P)-dependent oxidoreductase [Planctomycetota bacterium]